LISCRGSSITPNPIVVVNEPLPGNEIIVDGRALRLEVFLNRDFMPSTAPDTRLMAILRLVPNSGAVPGGLIVERASFSLGADSWDVVPKQESSGSSWLEVVARGGPMWPVGSRVDVVIRVRDASGKFYAMRVIQQTVTRSE
jgi:hypothetical protein